MNDRPPEPQNVPVDLTYGAKMLLWVTENMNLKILHRQDLLKARDTLIEILSWIEERLETKDYVHDEES